MTATPLNPCKFNEKDIVQSIYTGATYIVVVADKNGMAKLHHVKSGRIEDWNAHNNPHFVKATPQLNLF